jgi:hypothetical protein
MPTNTAFDPQNKNLFEKSKLNKAAEGHEFTVPAGTTQNLDITLTDDALIMDSCILIDGAAKGDNWTMQVVHPVYGVVFQGVTGWRVDFTTLHQPLPKSNFPAKIFAGLKLRIVYQSVGANDVWVCMNLDKDKVLV